MLGSIPAKKLSLVLDKIVLSVEVLLMAWCDALYSFWPLNPDPLGTIGIQVSQKSNFSLENWITVSGQDCTKFFPLLIAFQRLRAEGCVLKPSCSSPLTLSLVSKRKNTINHCYNLDNLSDLKIVLKIHYSWCSTLIVLIKNCILICSMSI